MKKLVINFDEIQKAQEDTERNAFDYFLDKQTGEIVILSSEIIRLAQDLLSNSYDDDMEDFEDVQPDEIPDIPDWVEDEVELALDIFMHEQARYERIPERKPANAYAAMKAFAETLENRRLASMLLQALDGQGSFRNFKNTLSPYPKERKLWYSFNAKVAKNEIEQWLSSQGIEPSISLHHEHSNHNDPNAP